VNAGVVWCPGCRSLIGHFIGRVLRDTLHADASESISYAGKVPGEGSPYDTNPCQCYGCPDPTDAIAGMPERQPLPAGAVAVLAPRPPAGPMLAILQLLLGPAPSTHSKMPCGDKAPLRRGFSLDGARRARANSLKGPASATSCCHVSRRSSSEPLASSPAAVNPSARPAQSTVRG
jgi:hypothetical protein